MTNEMLYERVLRRLAVTERELLGHCRRQDLVDARCLVAAALMRQPLTRQQDVAQILGTSQSVVSRWLSRHHDLLETDAGYRWKWSRIEQ